MSFDLDSVRELIDEREHASSPSEHAEVNEELAQVVPQLLEEIERLEAEANSASERVENLKLRWDGLRRTLLGRTNELFDTERIIAAVTELAKNPRHAYEVDDDEQRFYESGDVVWAKDLMEALHPIRYVKGDSDDTP